ncbi:IS3 family transposase [Priestia aryabhattai]
MAKKGQTFTTYTKELKSEVVRLKLEEGWSYSQLREHFGIKSDAQIAEWVKKVQNGESFNDQRGQGNKKNFDSLEDENAYLKAQVEYFKKAQSKSTWEGVVLKAQHFDIIDKLRVKHPLTWLFQIAEVSRAGYYKWRKTYSKRVIRLQEDGLLKEHILAIHKLHPYLGYKRMTTALAREGLYVNHKRVRRLMRELGIRAVIRKKRPFYGRRGSVVFPNILDQKFYAEEYYQKLVTDITYIRIGLNSFVYLSAVLDLYNNEIVAWEMSSKNDLELVQNTVNQLNETFIREGETLLHSDQGFQYTTKRYQKLLESKKVIGSHSRKGNCFDNACIESFFSHLKTEKIYLVSPKNFGEALQAVNEYVFYYNNDRFQKKYDDLSPIEFREKAAA